MAMVYFILEYNIVKIINGKCNIALVSDKENNSNDLQTVRTLELKPQTTFFG